MNQEARLPSRAARLRRLCQLPLLGMALSLVAAGPLEAAVGITAGAIRRRPSAARASS